MTRTAWYMRTFSSWLLSSILLTACSEPSRIGPIQPQRPPIANKEPPPRIELPAGAHHFWGGALAQKERLNAIWGIEDNWFAVGTGGFVLTRQKGRFSLETISNLPGQPPLDAELLDVWGASREDVWAVGKQGVIVHYDGVRWARVVSPAQTDLLSVWGNNAHDVWIGGRKGTILRWDGKSWKAVDSGSEAPMVSVFRCDSAATDTRADASDVCFLADGGALPSILLEDGSEAPAERARVLRWTGRWAEMLVPAAEPTQAFTIGDRYWIVDRYGTRVHIPEEGRWKKVLTPRKPGTQSGVVRKVWSDASPGGSGHRWAIGGGRVPSPERTLPLVTSTIWRWEDDAWQVERDTPGGPLRGVWGASGNDIWAVGEHGTVLHYDGTVWRDEQVSATMADLHSVWMNDVRDGWAVGDGGVILHFDGVSWNSVGEPGEYRLRDVWSSSSRDVWAVGECGVILHYDGKTWQPRKASHYFPVTVVGDCDDYRRVHYSVWGTGPDNVWFAGSGGFLYRFDGDVLEPGLLETSNNLIDITGTGRGDMWIASRGFKRGDLYHFDGETWSQTPLPADNTSIRAVFSVSTTDVWAAEAAWADDEVTLLRWDGDAWQVHTALEVPARSPYLVPDLRRHRSRESYALWGRSAKDVWLSGPRGFLAHWDGARWTVQPRVTRSLLAGARWHGRTLVGGRRTRHDPALSTRVKRHSSRCAEVLARIRARCAKVAALG